jgi:hypothetical protein
VDDDGGDDFGFKEAMKMTDHDFTMAVIRETTNDFVECFSKPENQIGIMARLTLEFLPEGVDPNDQRVKDILQQIRERHPR